MDEIRPGDVVELKSGGVTMTVGNVGNYGYDTFASAECHWFVGPEDHKGLFPLHTLQKVDMHGSVK